MKPLNHQIAQSANHEITLSPRAVLFDLDGTLTKPYFDFDAIRREIGLPIHRRDAGATLPILESLERMTAADRARVEAILHRHEERAAAESELQEGAVEVLAAIRARGVPLGLMTRNSRRSVETVIGKHGLAFDAVRTREDGPTKPSPEPVLAMCRRLKVAPESAWVVGDFEFDVLSGNAAGATSVLMIGDAPVPAFASRADHVIRRLRELLPLLRLSYA